ncbi:hypothetical protein NM688_g7871 [Phlebia brevispora]|uniref:Uncharacterized protein n=1 Tax=Phlebia brevispora TaxID=194682 RepID=A0ACC1S034_9APHY|nr:hypothetical protein NM688_g7871 [Phlebia brevispora]
MASWVLPQTPWGHIFRLRPRLDVLGASSRFRLPGVSKTFFSSPILGTETPAMIAIRKQKYPTSNPDSSIFEDITQEEYQSHAPTVSARNTAQYLIRLVRHRKYAEAQIVFEEMQALHQTPHPSPWFERMAFHILHREDLPDRERKHKFLAWWNLLHLRDKPSDQARFTYKLLSQSFVPNLKVIMRFSLILASIGLERQISRTIIPIIVRHADPDLTLAFLERYKRADLNYRRIASSKAKEPFSVQARQHDRRFAELYGLAVRNHYAAGRMRAAMTLLQSALDQDLPVRDFTFRFAVSRVRESPYTRHLPFIVAWREKSSLRRMRSKKDPVTVQSRTSEPQHHLRTQLHPTRFWTSERGIPTYCPHSRQEDHSTRSPQSLARDAWVPKSPASLLNHILSRRQPTPTAFRDLIGTYGLKDPETLGKLRHILYRTRPSPKVITSWLYSEMQALIKNKRDEAVLLLFVNNFWCASVPIATLSRMFKVLNHIPVGPKRWPPRQHVALIWRIAISHARTHGFLERLYREMLDIAREYAVGVPRHIADADRAFNMRPRASPAQFDDILWSHFIDAFAFQGSIARSVQIVEDMARHRIPVSKTSFNALVRVLQRQRTQGVINLLDKLDRRAARAQEGTMVQNTLVLDEASPIVMPHPLIVVYLAVYARLMKTGEEDSVATITNSLRIRTEGFDFDVDTALERVRVAYLERQDKDEPQAESDIERHEEHTTETQDGPIVEPQAASKVETST